LQRDAEVASAVLANCFTRIVFRVGDADARALSEGFSTFEGRDLQNLDIGEAVCRVERSDYDFNLSVPFSDSAIDSAASRDAIIASSRAKYAKPRAEIETEFQQKRQPEPPAPEAIPQPVLETSAAAPPETPKAVEPVAPVPKVSEPEPVPEEIAQPVPVAPEPEITVPPIQKPLGKGGQKHKYLQNFIRQWAQGMGYMAVIEQQIEGGQVDVALQKNSRKIACEISVTTPAEHEIGNIKKCLSADFEFVVLVVPDEKRLPGLRKAVGGVLSEAEAARVRFFTPDQLFAFVEELDAKDASKSETIRGYKVKVKHTVVDNASKADRKQMLAKIIGDSKKRKKD